MPEPNTFIRRLAWPADLRCARCGELPGQHKQQEPPLPLQCRGEAVRRVIEAGRTRA